MQKITTQYVPIVLQKIATYVVFFAIPVLTHADGELSINGLLYKIFYHIINPLIMVAMAGSVLWFMYGVIDFLRKRDTNIPEAEDGKRHMLYGLLGLFIFVSAFAIARIMSSILGGGVPTP